jgi:hypothetical protein
MIFKKIPVVRMVRGLGLFGAVGLVEALRGSVPNLNAPRLGSTMCSWHTSDVCNATPYNELRPLVRNPPVFLSLPIRYCDVLVWTVYPGVQNRGAQGTQD